MSIELYSQSQTKLSAGCDTFDATAYFESYYMNSVYADSGECSGS